MIDSVHSLERTYSDTAVKRLNSLPLSQFDQYYYCFNCIQTLYHMYFLFIFLSFCIGITSESELSLLFLHRNVFHYRDYILVFVIIFTVKNHLRQKQRLICKLLRMNYLDEMLHY